MLSVLIIYIETDGWLFVKKIKSARSLNGLYVSEIDGIIKHNHFISTSEEYVVRYKRKSGAVASGKRQFGAN
jgi:hypothetical protein